MFNFQIVLGRPGRDPEMKVRHAMSLSPPDSHPANGRVWSAFTLRCPAGSTAVKCRR
jgi:hypothetical protein